MLVDGLGHGSAAEAASLAAIDELESFEAGVSVEEALTRIHERLRGTRGAAATLGFFDDEGVILGGVGNVSVRSLGSPSLPFVPDSGVLGGRIRKPRSTRIELEPGARMLLHTDGIVRTSPFEAIAGLDAEAMCAILLEKHSHSHDDATLIHVTYLGPGADPSRPRA
jgi:negative regulator of sigma-B (phosphoserine phosphatase)